jgi:hypothetical protein
MKPHRLFLSFGTVCLLLAVTGCPPPPPPSATADMTPPVFEQVLIRLESATPPNPRGEFDVASQDVIKGSLAKDLTIRVIALAGDTESGIRSITLESKLEWQCAFGRGSELIGIFTTNSLTFSPAISPPTAPMQPLQINVSADPISQTGCDMSMPGKGPVNVRGFVRAVAINGSGRKTTSKTFIFDYKDVGVPR